MPPNKITPEPLENFSDINNVPISVLGQMGGFWRTVVDEKKRQHDVSMRRIIVGQLFTIVVVGIASILIEDNQDAFLLFGATLLLYPALTDLLMSSGSVLNANIHHDLERQDESTYRFSLLALLRAIVGTILAGTIVGTVAGIIAATVLSFSFLETLSLAVVASALAGGVGLPLVMFITFVARNIKSNPDEVVPPFQNSVFNVVMLLSIAVASRLLA